MEEKKDQRKNQSKCKEIKDKFRMDKLGNKQTIYRK